MPFTISVDVTGLVGSGMIVTLHANQTGVGEELPIPSDGLFSFSTQGLSGLPFTIFVTTQPTSPSQTCSVQGGGGIVGQTDVVMAVVCLE